jgi:small subunit ribosomal protein S5
MARDYNDNKEFEENVISIDRVARAVKGGRRFRFRALVVVGDGKNRVGIGIAKGGDVQRSIQKAIEKAKRNLVTIAITDETIPHEVQARQTGAIVLLKPARPGTGTG